jgi:ATP-dependent Lon protease
VRNLERELAKLARKGLTKILKKEVETVEVTPDTLEDMLGVRRYKYGLAELEDQVGVVTGLAWTSVGGDLLSIEALRLPGKGRMKTTGKLGDVMKESIDAAASYVRSIAPKIGVKPPRLDHWDIHVHVPEGATPKDGPSAGIAMVTSIVSVLTQIAGAQGHRHDRRGDAARQCPAHRRAEGKASGRAARRDHHGADPARTTKRTCPRSPTT